MRFRHLFVFVVVLLSEWRLIFGDERASLVPLPASAYHAYGYLTDIAKTIHRYSRYRTLSVRANA